MRIALTRYEICQSKPNIFKCIDSHEACGLIDEMESQVDDKVDPVEMQIWIYADTCWDFIILKEYREAILK